MGIPKNIHQNVRTADGRSFGCARAPEGSPRYGGDGGRGGMCGPARGSAAAATADMAPSPRTWAEPWTRIKRIRSRPTSEHAQEESEQDLRLSHALFSHIVTNCVSRNPLEDRHKKPPRSPTGTDLASL